MSIYKNLYVFKADIGTFSIAHFSGRWYAMFEDQVLGNYPSAHQAAYDIATEHVFCSFPETDSSEPCIPSDLFEWEWGG